ncbi:MAG: hypothetical protein ACM3JI_05720 [Anaerolineae bacterium]
MPSASAIERNPERYAAIALSPTKDLIIDLDSLDLSSRINILQRAMASLQRDYQDIAVSQDRISASQDQMSEKLKNMFKRVGTISENNRQMKEDYRQMRENNRQMRENLDSWDKDMDEFSAYLDLQSQKPKKIIKELKKRGKKRKLNKKSGIKQHRSHTSKSPSISPPSTQENSPSLVMRVSNLLLSPVFAFLALIKRVFSDENKKVS